MKFLLMVILSCFFCFFPVYSQDLGSWEVVDTLFKRNKIWGVIGPICVDSLNCMCALSYGEQWGTVVRRTTDGGSSWANVFADTSFDDNNIIHPNIRSMQYPSKNLCIVVGDSGLVIRSTDNGDSWETYRYDTLMIFTVLRMYDEYEGYMFGGRIDSMGMGPKTRFWKTTDGGASWVVHPYPNEPYSYLLNTEIINRNLIIGDYRIQIDEDSALTDKLAFIRNDWTEFDSVVKPRFCNHKHFLDENTGWIAGDERYIDSLGEKAYRQLIYHTSDGGKTWETQRNKFFHNASITEIKFYDKNFGIAGSEIRWILMTFDGGKTWNEIRALEYKPGAFNWIDHISIPSPNVAYVFSSWPDEILKWTRTPTSAVEDFNGSDFFITPNPASDYIEINNYMLSGAKEPEIKVYDVLGGKLMDSRLRGNDIIVSDVGNVRIDISSLNPGVYFVKVGGKVSKFVKM